MNDHETVIVNQLQDEKQIRLKIKKLDGKLERLRREEEEWSHASFVDKLLGCFMGFLIIIGTLGVFCMLAQAGMHFLAPYLQVKIPS